MVSLRASSGTMQGRMGIPGWQVKKELGATVAACDRLGGALFSWKDRPVIFLRFYLGIGRAGRCPFLGKLYLFMALDTLL